MQCTHFKPLTKWEASSNIFFVCQFCELTNRWLVKPRGEGLGLPNKIIVIFWDGNNYNYIIRVSFFALSLPYTKTNVGSEAQLENNCAAAIYVFHKYGSLSCHSQPNLCPERQIIQPNRVYHQMPSWIIRITHTCIGFMHDHALSS